MPALAPSGQTGIGAHATIAVFLPRLTVEVRGQGSGRQIIAICPPVASVAPVVVGVQHGQSAPVAPLAPVEPCGM